MNRNEQKSNKIMKDRRTLLISTLASGAAAMLMPHKANASISLLTSTQSELVKKTTKINIGKRNLGLLSVSSKKRLN